MTTDETVRSREGSGVTAEIALNNAVIVTGDEKTVLDPGAVLIRGETIAEVREADFVAGDADCLCNLGRAIVMPGAINPHSHGCTPGPLFASGAPGLSPARVRANCDRHLGQGHTSVVNLDGFTLPSEMLETSPHDVSVFLGSIHMPIMAEAAHLADGSGLTPAREKFTVEEALEKGAVVIGEVGAGHTLGGGGQDYMYIPAALKSITGRDVDRVTCTALKYAVLGRRATRGDFDAVALEKVLTESGLDRDLEPSDARRVVEECVLPSIEPSLEGIEESARKAVELDAPTVLHHSAPSEEAVIAAAEVAGQLVIAGHANHPTFTVEECLVSAERLKARGAWIEVDTFDSFSRARPRAASSRMRAMLASGRVDFIATDYAAGNWDSIWCAVHMAVQERLVSLPLAVAMATSRVVTAIPRLGTDRGRIAPGCRADLVVTSGSRLSDIRFVFVAGRTVL